MNFQQQYTWRIKSPDLPWRSLPPLHSIYIIDQPQKCHLESKTNLSSCLPMLYLHSEGFLVAIKKNEVYLYLLI